MYLPINLKGTKPHNMPRHTKKRGKQAAYRGISHHKVCLLSAIDQEDAMVFKIAGLGVETTEMVLALQHLFMNGNESNKPKLISDMKQVYRNLAKNTVREHIEIKASGYKSATGETLADINQLHSEFKQLMRRYHGVSTRHLQGYLDFFILTKQLHYQYKEQSSKHIYAFLTAIYEGNYIKRLDIFKKELPIDLYHAYGPYQYGIYSKPIH